jgi:endonuclease YncB( thermonuclease family)
MKSSLSILFVATATAAAAFFAPDSVAQQFDAKVLSVQSADSFTASVYGRPWRIRLAEVVAKDAQGRNALNSMVGGRMVSVQVVGTDADGRMVAKVSASGTDVGSALLGKGVVKAGNPIASEPSYSAEKLAAAKPAPRAAAVGTSKPDAAAARTSGSGNINDDEIRAFLRRTQDMVERQR